MIKEQYKIYTPTKCALCKEEKDAQYVKAWVDSVISVFEATSTQDFVVLIT